MLALDKNEPAIRRGIRLVAVGKKGSKPLPLELAQEITAEIKEGNIPQASLGAFLGALFVKGVSEEELVIEEAFTPRILNDPQKLIKSIASEAPYAIQEICLKLLNKEELDKNTSTKLGNFLFSNEKGDAARGLVSAILRVRYETADEYEGLLESIHQTLEPGFKTPVPDGDPIIQIAEPFDGVDQSYLVTPLLAEFLQNFNYRAVSLVGRNSGPKSGNNLLDLALALNASFLKASEKLAQQRPRWGWFLHQHDLSKALDRWVELRHKIIKRPFLATLERFVNPFKAEILIASAFHPPYGEKMLAIAQRAGFRGILIIRNGIEGTIAAPLLRPVKMLCSRKDEQGRYSREEVGLDPQTVFKTLLEKEEIVKNPSLMENVRLIELFSKESQTDNPHFDYRVKMTCTLLKKGLNWIKEK